MVPVVLPASIGETIVSIKPTVVWEVGQPCAAQVPLRVRHKPSQQHVDVSAHRRKGAQVGMGTESRRWAQVYSTHLPDHRCRVACKKTALFFEFSYVCPEPVLAK